MQFVQKFRQRFSLIQHPCAAEKRLRASQKIQERRRLSADSAESASRAVRNVQLRAESVIINITSNITSKLYVLLTKYRTIFWNAVADCVLCRLD